MDLCCLAIEGKNASMLRIQERWWLLAVMGLKCEGALC